MTDIFCPQNSSSIWPEDKQTCKEAPLSVSMFSGHRGSLGCLESKKICITTKSCSTDSSSKKNQNAICCWKSPLETYRSYLCHYFCPSSKICHKPSTLNSETLILISFTQILSSFAEWHFPAYKATCPCGQSPPSSHPNNKQLTILFLKMKYAANSTATI